MYRRTNDFFIHGQWSFLAITTPNNSVESNPLISFNRSEESNFWNVSLSYTRQHKCIPRCSLDFWHCNTCKCDKHTILGRGRENKKLMRKKTHLLSPSPMGSSVVGMFVLASSVRMSRGRCNNWRKPRRKKTGYPARREKRLTTTMSVSGKME